MDLADKVWAGDIPVFLLIVRDGQHNVVDLDERGWAQSSAELMRGQATWHLATKTGSVVFSVAVADGEQPYYVARHFARSSAAEGVEQAHATAYGIGKKRLDGHVDRLWIFDNGQICTGDDVDAFGRAILASR